MDWIYLGRSTDIDHGFYSFCCVLTLLYQASILGCRSCQSFMRQFLIRTPKGLQVCRTKSDQKFIRSVIAGNANGCLNFCCYRQAAVIVTEPTLILY